MRTIARFAVLSSLALFSLPAIAGGGKPTIKLGESVELIPSMQYRARYLAHSGKDFKTGHNFDAFSQRARLGLKAKLANWATLHVQLQDVRRWGEETNTLGDFSANGFDVHQAWAQIGCARRLALRIGRQEIAFDGHRLIGTVGWTDQARSFDALLLQGMYKSLLVKAFWAKLGEKDAYKFTTNPTTGARTASAGSPKDIDLAGLWLHYKGMKMLRPSLVFIYDRNAVRDRDRMTFGLHLKGAPAKGLKFTGEFYYQAGKDGGPTGKAATRSDIGAMLASIRLGYTVKMKMKPTFEFFFDYLSGDDNTADNKVGVFDTLFATNHKFYGFMDYFLNIPVHTGGLGLIDIGGRIKIKPMKKVLFFVDIHHFRLAKQYKSTTGTDTADSLGTEIDVVGRYKLIKYVSFEGVFGTFLTSRGMTCIKGGCRDGADNEFYGYVQADVKF